MRRIQRLLFWFPPWMFATAAMAQGKFIQIGYSNCLQVAHFSQPQFDQIGQLKWYFAHASVGANIMDGIADLHRLEPKSYEIRSLTAGSSPPPSTERGVIYEQQRGNPGWKAKEDMFSANVRNGWHFPRVDVAINKLCFIDELASLNYYINSMTNLEAACPGTMIVYTTMPLTTKEDLKNYLRNRYNDRLRQWCRQEGKVLWDLADIEAHDPMGKLCTFRYWGADRQKLCPEYTSDGGHLNERGRDLVARSFYAMGAALAMEHASPRPDVVAQSAGAK